MEYLGEFIPRSSYRDDDGNWNYIPPRVVCNAQEVEEQIQCLLYEPASHEEILEHCHPAKEFTCKFCECGCRDRCSAVR